MFSGPAVGTTGAAGGGGAAGVVVVVVVVVVGAVLAGAGAAGAAATVAGVSGVLAERVVSHTSPGRTAEISRRTRSQTMRLSRVAPTTLIRSDRSAASAGFCLGCCTGTGTDANSSFKARSVARWLLTFELASRKPATTSPATANGDTSATCSTTPSRLRGCFVSRGRRLTALISP